METLVIGAGVIGSSVAMHLAQRGVPVRLVDFDLEGSFSSSELNAGGVRATWVQPLNIEMSKLTIDYLDQVSDEVGYRACGYLWLHSPEKMDRALKARERQLEMGWKVEAWDVAEIKRRVSFLDKEEGLAGAIFSPRDGLVNTNLLKNHFRARAKQAGAKLEDRVLVREVEYSRSGRIRVHADRYSSLASAEQKQEVLCFQNSDLGRERVQFEVDQVVNCAGAWAGPVAKILGYHSPSHAVRRQICLFDSRDVDLTPFGMMIEPSGVYFHPEATNGLAGFANHSEAPGYRFDYDGESFFNELIWPALYERSTKLEKLKHLSGWAGLYEVSPDESAILGPVSLGEAGRSGRVFEAHSFSGHGVMQSYSAGLVLAERMLQGRYETLDASPFGGERFESGKLLKETLVI